MKTDDLVAMLSANVEPVGGGLVGRAISIAVAAGAVIAVVPFAITIFAVRRAAPTNLVRAGAVAGLIAGGISAMGYALHCTDDTLPFVAVWYGGTIVLCTLAGAALGPRLLRW